MPRFVLREDSELLKHTSERLEERKRQGEASKAQCHIIVIPDRSKSQETPADADPQIVKFSNLEVALSDVPVAG